MEDLYRDGQIRIAELEAENAELESEVNTWKSHAVEASNRANVNAENVAAWYNEAMRLEDLVDDLVAERNALSIERNNALANLEAYQAYVAERYEEILQQIESLNTQIADLEAELEEAQEPIVVTFDSGHTSRSYHLTDNYTFWLDDYVRIGGSNHIQPTGSYYNLLDSIENYQATVNELQEELNTVQERLALVEHRRASTQSGILDSIDEFYRNTGYETTIEELREHIALAFGDIEDNL